MKKDDRGPSLTVQPTRQKRTAGRLRPAARGGRGERKAVPLEDGQHRSDIPVSLVRAALGLFASRNYSSVTIKDISSAVGVNPSLIYYYFGSKEGLFLEVVNYAVEEAFRRFNASHKEDVAPADIISQWIETHIIQFVLMQKLAKISLDYASTPVRSDTLDKAIRKFYDREAIVLGRAIRAGVAKGHFRQVEAQDTATFISTFLDGSLFRNMMFPTFDYAAAIESMRQIVLEHLGVDTYEAAAN